VNRRTILQLLSIIVIGQLLIACSGLGPKKAAEGPPIKSFATLPLVNCSETMDQPGFWIKKFVFPDKLLLTKKQIRKLNKRTYERGLLTDVFSDQLWDYKYEEVDRPEDVNPDGEWDLDKPMLHSPGVLEGYHLYTNLKDETVRIKRRKRWNHEGSAIPKKVFKELDRNLNLRNLKEHNPLSYGLTRRRSNIRYYPTDTIMTGRRWDTDFDIVQVSSIRALQPVVILHESKDKQWLFVVTAYCRGWIKASDVVGYCDPKAIKRYLKPKRKIVVTGHEVDVYHTKGNTTTAEKFYMGTVCPLLNKSRTYYTIALPKRNGNGSLSFKRAYIARSADVREGNLRLSTRQLLKQSFKLIHHPYSWGGQNEYRDCSQFLKDVYATFGINLPRNSSVQARVGSKRVNFSRRQSLFKKRKKLAKLDRPALLQFPGHIMLYLGRIGSHDYAIHDIWAYRVYKSPKKDDKVVIGKVVVSDLSLGEGSNKGSLLERLTTINPVKP